MTIVTVRRLAGALVAALPLALLPVPGSPAAEAGWHGDAHVQPAAYSWLGPEQPSDTYQFTVIRGPHSKAHVLRDLGGVRVALGRMTPAAALGYAYLHTNPTYGGPPVVQVAHLGPAIVLYEPNGFRAVTRLESLSRRSLVATFETTVEYDTYVDVARRGTLIREFDAGFRPPQHGALPQEHGLDFGAPHENIWATAWAFLERVTLIHVSKSWFDSPHATYVLDGRT